MSDEDSKKKPNFISLTIVIVVLVIGLISITKCTAGLFPQPTPAASPTVTLPSPTLAFSPTPTPAKILYVSVSFGVTVCEDNEKIDYSLVEINISGGQPPYVLTITNSKDQSESYTIIKENSPVQVKVYGGDYFIAVVRSNTGEIWSGRIGLPVEAEICKATLTPTLVPSATPTLTPVVAQPPTRTRNAGPTKTNITPDPQPTYTPHPNPTGTPKPTDTPVPPPTPTPINPNPRQCEDGIDNDKDGYTDYPADDDCKKPSDPREGKDN